MRNDIQGLRAFAVLSVIIYHVAPLRLPGGFIGVDVFFVISGYLIIASITKNLEAKRFNFSDFYNRRLSRLAPVYIVVTLVSACLLYNSLLPSEYTSFSRSAAASFAYISNFWFYTKAGYFDTELLTSPLLHTWSLSVEEQFYLIIPGILYLAYKMRISIRLTLAVLTILSLFAGIIVTNINQPAAFYFSPLRFWQFMIGGYTALYIRSSLYSSITRDIITFSSIAALIVCCFVISHDDFPGWKAIIPTILTAVILAMGNKTNISYKVIGWKLPKYIGDISYSLYLWHWPLIVYFSVEVSSDLAREYKLLVLLSTLVLSIISYHTIENPLRRALSKKSTKFNYTSYILICSVLTSGLIVASTFKSDSAVGSLSHYEGFLSYDSSAFRNGQCFLSSTSNDFRLYDKELCNTHTDGLTNMLLIGDSHAAHWYPALVSTFPNNSTTQATASGCKPVIGTTGPDRCVKLVEWVYGELINKYRFDKIIISARWRDNDITKLKQTLSYLAEYNTDVIVLGPIIEYNVPLPRLLAKGLSTEEVMNKSSYHEIKIRDLKIRSTTEEYARFISVLDTMCEYKTTCDLQTEDSIPLQFDYGHLTSEGATYIMKKMKYEIDSDHI